MTRLAVAATEILPVHGLHPTDVPAPVGFCVFAEPIATYLNEGGDFHGKTTSTVAVSWGDSPLMRLTRERGLWMPSGPASSPTPSRTGSAPSGRDSQTVGGRT